MIETEQRVEQRDQVGETGLKMMTSAMKHFFQRTDHRHQRQGGFDQHALVPCAARTQLEIGGNTSGIIETCIGKDDSLVLQVSDQRQEDLVMDIDPARTIRDTRVERGALAETLLSAEAMSLNRHAIDWPPCNRRQIAVDARDLDRYIPELGVLTQAGDDWPCQVRLRCLWTSEQVDAARFAVLRIHQPDLPQQALDICNRLRQWFENLNTFFGRRLKPKVNLDHHFTHDVISLQYIK